LNEYKSLHPDVRDEDIRVELPPAPQLNKSTQHAPGRGNLFPPPPAYVQVHHARNAHVPIAHPVVAIPFPAIPAPPFNPEHIFGPVDIGELHQHLPPRPDAPVVHPMPIPPYNHPLRAPPPQPYNHLQGFPPVPMPRLPVPPPHHPLQQMLPPVPLPPMQIATGPRPKRVSARVKRTVRR
jgi:hypothetical protein